MKQLTFIEFINCLGFDGYINDYLELLFDVTKRFDIEDSKLFDFFNKETSLERWLQYPVAWIENNGAIPIYDWETIKLNILEKETNRV
jgi:hypothetical protein